MHPPRKELIALEDKELADDGRIAEIATHLKNCEFCVEFLEIYRQLIKPLEVSCAESLPEKMNRLADGLYDAAIRSKIINLAPLTPNIVGQSVSYLAADGDSDGKYGVHSIATLYCENPDVVLRIMRAPDEDKEYLQILAEDDRLAKHVMVQVPELGREYITDADGRAGIDLESTKGLDKLKWQIKLPEAVFTLEPLLYDPDSVEYAREFSLETERHDLIRVRFEGKTEGKQLSIKVMELDGRPDFGPLKVMVTQNRLSSLISAGPGESIMVGLVDSETTINIRLYQ